MLVAWENGLIPIFSENLPHGEEISAVCDSFIKVPKSIRAANVAGSPPAMAKELWAKLLESCPKAQQSALSEFSKGGGLACWQRP